MIKVPIRYVYEAISVLKSLPKLTHLSLDGGSNRIGTLNNPAEFAQYLGVSLVRRPPTRAMVTISV